jgi:Flp pilus assembly protein TadD
MRPATSVAHLTMYVALCGVLLSCGSKVRAQGMSPRETAAIRYGNALPGNNSLPPLDSLANMPSESAIAPRVAPLVETISVHELLVPAGAVKEFQRSLKAVHSGDFQSAAEHLQKAIRIDPNFVQAHNNLGASYMQLSQYESAVSEFQRAIELDPGIQETRRNLGLGLFLLRRYREAEVAARQALQLDPQRNSARYTLGRILAAEGSSSAEAEQLLRQSVADFADARLPLARVLLNRGANDQAAAELRTYLKSPGANPDKKQAIACALAQITRTDENAACSKPQAKAVR